MSELLTSWGESAHTTAGLFWMAFWAFGLGYLISSLIQVFVTRARMREQMGGSDARSVGLGAFFGFISSSCSFAALSTTRALFARGAGAVPALAFMLASTNLVVELGIVIALFLSWQFVVAEYVGGVLLILIVGLLVSLLAKDAIIEEAREAAQTDESGAPEESETSPFLERLKQLESWRSVADKYLMEWGMVWKDVTIGFTVAGVIAVFVPASFFEQLFIGSGSSETAFYEVVAQATIGPIAAFFTFIGSMGNIPLAAVLFGSGVSFAGVIAFIFSDLVVFPVLRIQAEYYGWKIALGIAGIFMIAIVTTATGLHYTFDLLGYLPDPSSFDITKDREFFVWDYSAVLNILFILMTMGFVIWHWVREGWNSGGETGWQDYVLNTGVTLSFFWLAGGAVIELFDLASYLA